MKDRGREIRVATVDAQLRSTAAMGPDDDDTRDQGPEPSDVTPSARRRLPRSVYWRRRVMVAAVPVALGALAWGLTDSGSSDRGLGASSTSVSRSPVSGGNTSTTTIEVTTEPTGDATPSIALSTRVAATAAAWKLPAAVSGATVVMADGKAMVLGGRTTDGSTNAAVVSLDLHTGNATSLLGLPQPVEDAAGAMMGTRVVVMGGRASSTVQAVEGRTSATFSQLPGTRAGASAVTYGRDVIVVGGSDGSLPSRDVLRTSDGESFTLVGQLAVPVAYAATAAVNDKVIVVGGQTSGDVDSIDIQSFDLTTNTATIIGRLPRGRSHAASAVLDGKLLLFGGRSGSTVLDSIDEVDLDTLRLSAVGQLPGPTADAAVAVLGDVAYVLGGSIGDSNGTPTDAVTRVTLTSTSVATAPASIAAPFDGLLLIADSGNSRLIAVNASQEIVWQYPAPDRGDATTPSLALASALFTRKGAAIMAASPGGDTIIEVDYPSGKTLWTYGRADRAGSGSGFLNAPSDAFRRSDGSVIVADAGNCRVVEISAGKIPTAQMGGVGECHDHQPPNRLAGPTSVTPLANGNILVAEVNGSYVNELTLGGARVWTTPLAINRPSRPQQFDDDRYLVADASRPGGVYEFTRSGEIVFTYSPPAGEAMLDHPTQASMLPNGLIAVSDTSRQRVVILDPATSAVVWQYGRTDVAGYGPHQLASPRGFDLLTPDGSTPLHASLG